MQIRRWEIRDEGGTLMSFWDGKFRNGYRELAFVFDATSGTLHKWGETSQVSQWFDNAFKKYQEAGLLEMAGDLTLVSKPAEGPEKWDVELINKFINNTGFIGLWYKTSEFKKMKDMGE